MVGIKADWLSMGVVLFVVGTVGCMSSNTEKISDEEQKTVQELPQGHPVASLPTGPTDSANDLTWDVAESFVRVVPANAMRVAQYQLQAAGDEEENGELAVFYFGPGVGGGTEANLGRWAGQFRQADGLDPMQEARTETFTSSGGLKVTTIEVSGHYVSMSMGSGPSYDQEGWALYGAVVEGEKGPWFFKAVGPGDLMGRFHDALHQLYQDVRPASL